MKKIIPFKKGNLWGREVWLNSTIKGKETKFKDGTLCTEGPLIKITKLDKDLPIQVHPDDEMAQIVENKKFGQSKFWYVLDVPHNSSLVVGLLDNNEEAILKRHTEGTLHEILKKIKVHKNDFINLPAGIVYGMGAGLKVLEVSQQNEIVFYVHDFKREYSNKVKLDIKIEKALQAKRNVSHNIEPIKDVPLTYKTNLGTALFPTTLFHVAKKAIVVDLIKEAAFLAEDELIDFDQFTIIYI